MKSQFQFAKANETPTDRIGKSLGRLSVHHVSCADNLEFIFHSVGVDSVMFEFF